MERNTKLDELFLEIDRLKAQMHHFEGIVESERGTLAREAKRLKEDIDKVEKAFRDVVYDRDNGFIVTIDRLVQESKKRHQIQKMVVGLIIAVIGIVIKIIYDLITRK